MLAISVALIAIVVSPPPPPEPSPPYPPFNPPPSPRPPPLPPSDVFISNDALLGCSRGNPTYLHYSYHYGNDERETLYSAHKFNDTGLHNLVVNVDVEACTGRAHVRLPHSKNGHTYSLYTSSNSGTSWTLVSQHVYQVESPPPPTPSPPPPAPAASPSVVLRRLQELSIGEFGGVDTLHFTDFSVPKEPLYVRACIDCDGTCNGIDTIDALVSCNAASPASSDGDALLPWWGWIFVATTAVLAVVVCVRYTGATSSPPPPPPPPPPPASTATRGVSRPAVASKK